MSLGMKLGLGPGDFVLHGDPALFPQKGAEPPPQFSAHVYCGQTAGWMKLVLGMEVGLSSGDFVLDRDPAPSPKRGRSPSKFSGHFYCGQTAGCIKMPLGTDVGLSPGDFVLDGNPVPLPQKGSEAPNFRSVFIVAKRLDGSRCHLARRWASAQATLCLMGTQPPSHKGGGAPCPIFGPFLLWPNGWMH